MTSTRRFRPCDLFRFNAVNLDNLTETYNMNFYMQYMLQWPECQQSVLSPSGEVVAYIIGKSEGEDDEWHGHVSAVTVSPEYRRLGLASRLMELLEELWDSTYKCYFVDLFVRKTNAVAIGMYRAMGYIVYRTIINYYGGSDDAYDMRKALSRDTKKLSVIPVTGPVRPEDVVITM